MLVSINKTFVENVTMQQTTFPKSHIKNQQKPSHRKIGRRADNPNKVSQTNRAKTQIQTPRRNHNKKTALHFYKNDAISRRSLLQGVGATNNLLLSTATDNISREKNKQTTHLKRRNSPTPHRTSETEP